MKFEDVMEKDHYRSIIALTYRFGEKAGGLRQLHYRYALTKNHDGIKQTYFIEEMKRFFGEELNDLYKKKNIVKNCITNRNNLTNFLKRLSTPPLEILTKIKDEKDGLPKYQFSDKYYAEWAKWHFKQKIDSMPADSYEEITNSCGNIIDITKELEPFILPDTTVQGGVFGVDFLETCTKEEKKIIDECFFQIYLSLAKLAKLKTEKTDDNTEIVIAAEAFVNKN